MLKIWINFRGRQNYIPKWKAPYRGWKWIKNLKEGGTATIQADAGLPPSFMTAQKIMAGKVQAVSPSTMGRMVDGSSNILREAMGLTASEVLEGYL